MNKSILRTWLISNYIEFFKDLHKTNIDLIDSKLQ